MLTQQWITHANNQWLRNEALDTSVALSRLVPHPLNFEVLEDEQEVAQYMLAELLQLQRLHKEEINVVLLGGRGGQNFHRLLSSLAHNPDYIPLFSRLNLFMQDALSPLSEASPLSFEASFRANLGAQLLDRIRGFYPIDSNPA